MRSRSRYGVGAAALVIVALVGAAVGWVLGGRSAEPEPGPRTEADVHAAPFQVEASGSADVAGVAMPVSRTHGPRVLEDGRARGFSDSEAGAALAAVHLLMRTSAAAGSDVFEGTLSTQALGANVTAMRQLLLEQYAELRSTQDVADGAPLPIGDADVRGYKIQAYQPGTAATVDVLLSSAVLDEQQRLAQFRVVLQRTDDDWWLVAPPRGDWGAVAVPLGSEPLGLQRYEDIL